MQRAPLSNKNSNATALASKPPAKSAPPPVAARKKPAVAMAAKTVADEAHDDLVRVAPLTEQRGASLGVTLSTWTCEDSV